MTYNLKWYELEFIKQLNSFFSNNLDIKKNKKNGILSSVKLEKLLEKIERYFENEAFFDEWEIYDPNLPENFLSEEIELIKLIPGWSSWNPRQQSLRQKLEKIASDEPKELYLSALDGDIEKGVKLFNIYLNNEHLSKDRKTINIDDLKEVFLKRKTLLTVLEALKNNDYPKSEISLWGLVFKVSSPYLNADEDTFWILQKLRKVGYSIDSTIENDELEEMIALMSLPDETDNGSR